VEVTRLQVKKFVSFRQACMKSAGHDC